MDGWITVRIITGTLNKKRSRNVQVVSRAIVIGKLTLIYFLAKPKSAWFENAQNSRTDTLFGIKRVYHRTIKQYSYCLICGRLKLVVAWIKKTQYEQKK